MTTEEFIKVTQPIVDLVAAVAKIKYGEHSERYITVIASIMDAQAKKNAETIFAWLNKSVLAVNDMAYIIKAKLNKEEK